MLRNRLMMGAVLIVAAVGLFWLESASQRPGLAVGITMLLVSPLAMIEWRSICKAKGIETSCVLMTLAAIGCAAAVYHGPTPDVLGGVLAITFAAALIWHCRHKTTQGAIGAASATVLAAVYIGVFGSFYMLISRDYSSWVALGVLLVTKMGDTGAYFTGRAIGRHKLIPWLSPGKTWEGLGGAVVWCAGFAALFAWIGQRTQTAHIPVATAAIIGVVIAIVGHAGDLSMSMFKRDAGVKDSGRIMPGFGGVLDVLDSPLLVGPAAYWLLRLL